jgi:micrococcal nuclease
VLDGDTISVVMEGDPPSRAYTVRYLGIDAPPNTASVPWGVVAYETNRNLTKGKVVRLERDQSDVDEEGNLLRYVYLGDELVSIILAERGLARANVVEPDTRYQAEITAAEAGARNGSTGLWGNPPTRTPASVIAPTTAVTTTATTTATVAASETTEAEATTEESAGSASPTSEVAATGTTEPEAEDTSPDNAATTEPN